MNGSCYGYRFTNGLSLNDSHPDLMVNYVEYWERDKKDKDGTEGKQHIFTWATSLDVTIENVQDIGRAGLTRRRVGGVRGSARSNRFPAPPPRTGHAPLSASGSPLRCGVPPFQHRRTRTNRSHASRCTGKDSRPEWYTGTVPLLDRTKASKLHAACRQSG